MLDDPNGELLKQLTRIADLLSKPAPSPWIDWIKTLAAFLIGIASGYVGLLLQARVSDKREQHKMRRIVYSEVAESFLLLHGMAAAAGNQGKAVRLQLHKEPCTFMGEH